MRRPGARERFMRGMLAVLTITVGLFFVVGTSVPAAAKKQKAAAEPTAPASPEELKTKFKTFCDGWMEKLRER
jgi:hypothetical protein